MVDSNTLDAHGVCADCTVRVHRWVPPVRVLPGADRMAHVVELELPRRRMGDAGAIEIADAVREPVCVLFVVFRRAGGRPVFGRSASIFAAPLMCMRLSLWLVMCASI